MVTIYDRKFTHLKDAYWLKNKSLENLISECKKQHFWADNMDAA